MYTKIKEIKFSIILVTFKRCDLVLTCLKEIFLQLKNRDDWEILLVVNGDDQKTLSALQEKYPRIIPYKTPAISPAEARNFLIKKAKGEYLCFLDDDTMPCENYFKTALEFIADHNKVDVFGGPDTVFPNASFFENTVGFISPLSSCYGHYEITS